MPETKMKGLIKKVFKDKGYGFLRGQDKVDYFFHASELKNGLTMDSLIPDETSVLFEGDAKYPKGARAIDLEPID